MDFFEIVKTRRSVRVFTSQPVEDGRIERILRTVNSAPSGGNLQAYEVFVATDAERKRALAEAAFGQDFVRTAPFVLVFCAHPARARKYGQRGERLYSVQDATIACTYAMLAAEAEGLATVWVGAFRDEEVWQAIGSPEGLTPVAMLPVGYAGEQPEATSRRALSGLVHRL
jgi:nitroreductase